MRTRASSTPFVPALALAAGLTALPLAARAQAEPPPPQDAQTVEPLTIEASPPPAQPAPQPATQPVQPAQPAPGPVYAPYQPYPPSPAYYNGGVAYVPMRRVVVPYQGGPIPPGARVHTRRPVAVIAVSGGAFVVSYIVSAYYSVLSSYSSGASIWGLVPLVGPWLALTDGAAAQRAGAFYVIDGLVQGAGFTLAMVALQIRHRELWMYQPAAGAAGPVGAAGRRERRGGFEWAAVPMAGEGVVGLSAVGVF